MINGIINVYKEAGFTSHDVVAKLRGICKQKKIGHTGTLDPAAVGVLPVCLGNGTRLCDMLTDKSKEYEAVMLLGCVTDTQDTTGQILEEHEVDLTEEQVKDAILSFLGNYEQIPPMYSALKVNGKKLYELARAGKEVERKSRPVSILSIEILDMKLPEVTFRVGCSKGTYIRTLCHDIGQKLGCGGTMKSLKRTRVGSFAAEDALTLAQIEDLAHSDQLLSAVVPVEQMFAGYSALIIKPDYEKLLENGNSFYRNQILREEFPPKTEIWDCNEDDGTAGWKRVCNQAGRFYGIYAFDEKNGRYQPVKMFL